MTTHGATPCDRETVTDPSFYPFCSIKNIASPNHLRLFKMFLHYMNANALQPTTSECVFATVFSSQLNTNICKAS